MKVFRVFASPDPASVFMATDYDGTSAEVLRGTMTTGMQRTGERRAVHKVGAPLVPVVVYAIGLNYRRHAAEVGATPPEQPVVFFKAPTAVVGPDEVIRIPRTSLVSTKTDYEAELAIVIGKECRNATTATALDFVFGYTCGNDVSARDWQLERSGGQWCRGKSFDTFCPLGPCVTTADEIPDPQGLGIRTRWNGVTVQSSSTADMIFSVAQIIAFLSADTTLLPGTVILTGTPEGVGIGHQPPRFLQPGDTLEVEIDHIGVLRNSVA
jgi:2-keto-4-pentenoate hydratase/2-oxohepta-3-ene-1,7-dioic acid hydratase in catechol pathway